MKTHKYLTDAQLKSELDRCLYCKHKPCKAACPVDCSPADFIMAAKCEGKQDLSRAAETILSSNPLGQICGVACPDQFCMKACSRSKFDTAIKIPAVQATILEKARKSGKMRVPTKAKPRGKKVAVVGAGPAGLSAAALMASYGYAVTLFEKSAKVGGAAALIPKYRLPEEVINADFNFVKSLGDVAFKPNTEIKDPESLLNDGFSGVILAVGETTVQGMGIDGESLAVSYVDYLNSPQNYVTDGEVAIIGGGAVATDCATTAKFQGSGHVQMFVRRGVSDMRLTKEEREWLLDSKIDITPMTRVDKIVKDGSMFSLKTCTTRFKNGKLEDLPNSMIERPDYKLVIMAIGSRAMEKSFKSEYIIHAGDLEHGGSTVVEACASGKNAACKMLQLLAEKGEEFNCSCSVDSKVPESVSVKAKSCVKIPGVSNLPVDLTTDFFGFKMRSPFLLSAAPHTDGYDQMKLAYEAGWAGGVMKTAFDNVPIHIPAGYMFAFSDSTFANCDNVSDHPLDRMCREIEKLRKEYPDRLTMGGTGGPVTGNDDFDRKGWQSNTKKLENAGALAVEYSLSCPQGGDGTEGDIVSQNAALTQKIIEWILECSNPDVPKFFKLSGAVTSIIPIIRAVQAAQAKHPTKKSGITLANSFPSLAFRPRVSGKGKWDEAVVVGAHGEGVLPVSYLSLANAAPTGIYISGNGGPMSYLEAANFLALGVKNVQFCSIALKYGVGIIKDLEMGLSHLLFENGLKSVKDLIGITLPKAVTDFMDLTPLKQIPTVDTDLCVSCGNCANCGYQAITFDAHGKPVFDAEKCVGCSFCTKMCFTKALKMRDRTPKELATHK